MPGIGGVAEDDGDGDRALPGLERVGEVDVGRWMGAGGDPGLPQLERHAEVGDGIRGHHDFEGVEPRQEVLGDVRPPALEHLVVAGAGAPPRGDDGGVDSLDDLDHEGPRARRWIEDLDERSPQRGSLRQRHLGMAPLHLPPGRHVGQAVREAEIAPQHLVGAAHDERHHRPGGVIDAARLLLRGVVRAEERLVEMDHPTRADVLLPVALGEDAPDVGSIEPIGDVVEQPDQLRLSLPARGPQCHLEQLVEKRGRRPQVLAGALSVEADPPALELRTLEPARREQAIRDGLREAIRKVVDGLIAEEVPAERLVKLLEGIRTWGVLPQARQRHLAHLARAGRELRCERPGILDLSRGHGDPQDRTLRILQAARPRRRTMACDKSILCSPGCSRRLGP